MRVLNLLAQRKPQCLPLISQMTQTNPKTKTTKLQQSHEQQTVFICEIMQLTAFLCVICAICGRIFTQEYSSYHRETTMSPADLADSRRQSPNNYTNYKLSFSTTSESCIFQQNTCIVMKNLLPLHH